MLTEQQKTIIRATVPALREHGVAIVMHFYRNLLEKNPALKSLFNATHQARGQQQKALAAAVLAYAENIDKPEVLAGALKHIAVKHCTVGVRPEHYPIIGGQLLASIKTVLGDAATKEVIEAWAAAYQQLADLLIQMEANLYAERSQTEGGWSGWRSFRVVERKILSEDVVGLTLFPTDGGKVARYLPGQFVSVKTFVKSIGLEQPRQYSLTRASDDLNATLSIAVKRVRGDETPDGVMSAHLHDEVKEGDVIELSAPMGNFTLDTKETQPLVFLAAGIGITPILSMVDSLAVDNPTRPVTILYSTTDGAHFPFEEDLRHIVSRMPNARLGVFFSKPRDTDEERKHYDVEGRINVLAQKDLAFVENADYYLCGPVDFMRDMRNQLIELGVIHSRIFSETFDTGSWD